MSPWSRWGLFSALWLVAGFTTGTATLLGPVRWIAEYGRARAWTSGAERAAVVPVIAIFVVGSALLAWALTAIVAHSDRAHVRIGLPALALAAAAGTLWLWLTPQMMSAGMGLEEDVGASFTFGPYPTEARMRELKRGGYTAIVSLLHPLVVPFEPKLIADGRSAAARADIDFIHVPMLPWVSDNTVALARIEELARQAGGRRYYVHCYLGRDRVRLAEHAVELADPMTRVAPHRFEDLPPFERGAVVQVERGIYLTPYPVDDEFMSFILPGDYGHVVSLLDPARGDDLPWIDKERELLAAHRIPFELRPLPLGRFDPARALAIARETAEMERPLVVHAFLGLDSGRSPAAEAFVQAFRSGLPPLPPALFAEPLASGPARVVAPNVAVGPRPADAEFAGYLAPRGVHRVLCVGGDAAATDEDRQASESAGLPWSAAAADTERLLDRLEEGGPWYVYGPGLAQVEPRIVARLGPAIPGTTRADASATTFFDSLWPSPRDVVLFGPPLLLFASLAAAFAGWLRDARGVAAPYTRKVFHFLIFSAAGLLHLAGGLRVVALFGGIVSLLVLYAVWRGDGFAFFEALARPSDAPRRSLFVLVPLLTTAAGGLAANLFFGAAAWVGYLVAGWGDAIAEPVGTRWGRHRYRVLSIGGVPATRSLEGSAAVLVVGSLAAFLGLSLAGEPLGTALGVAAACGAAGAAVEAVSNHGLDNLTVQIAAAAAARFLLG